MTSATAPGTGDTPGERAAGAGAPRRGLAPAPPTLVHSGSSVERYFVQHFQGAVFPLAAGLLLYGWRALLVCAVVIGSTTAAAKVWSRIGRRGRDLAPGHAAWLGLLLALTLPAHLGSLRGIFSHHAAFWLLPAAGVMLAIVLWVLRGLAGTGIHPVAVTALLLVPVFQETLVPRYVLQRDHLFFGNLLDAPRDPTPLGTIPWWFTRSRTAGNDAVVATPASHPLLNYTLGRREMPDRGVILLTGLLRDRVPPLEDLVVAGNPGPIGTNSVIFVIVGGLFLLYRGVIDYRIPLLIMASAFAALLVLPIPVEITEAGPRWAWLAARDPSVGWAVAITFVNYELAASPLVFTAFFLATSPIVRPITRRSRTVFAIAVGVLAAALQLYASVAWGPYAALLIAGLLTPLADRFFHPKPLA
jgi:Na+-translocating ferredoxin:NAD+ oxidoreductase RnfD subunit